MSCDLYFPHIPSCRAYCFPTIYCIQRFAFALFFCLFLINNLHKPMLLIYLALLGESFGPRTPPPRDLHFSVKLNLGSDGSEKIFFSVGLKNNTR